VEELEMPLLDRPVLAIAGDILILDVFLHARDEDEGVGASHPLPVQQSQ
jgi:hypothetical protein